LLIYKSTSCKINCSFSDISLLGQQTITLNLKGFHPRDAMLPRVLAIARCHSVCLSVRLCLSVISRCSIKRNERINLFLAWRLFSTSLTRCFKEIQISTKIRVIPAGTFSPTLSLDSRWSTKLIIPQSSDARPVYRRDRQALSTARFCRAGQLATADTCQIFRQFGSNFLFCSQCSRSPSKNIHSRIHKQTVFAIYGWIPLSTNICIKAYLKFVKNNMFNF